MLLVRIQRNMMATKKHGKRVFPHVMITGMLDRNTRNALIPLIGGEMAPQGRGGRTACCDATWAGNDQGVDFTGKGNIYALADGVVTRVDNNSGWPGGHIIVYRMTSGSRSGQYVYVAEAPIPAVQQGEKIAKGQKIATLDSSYPGTEIGFAQNARGDAFGSMYDGKNGNPAPYGDMMDTFIRNLSR